MVLKFLKRLCDANFPLLMHSHFTLWILIYPFYGTISYTFDTYSWETRTADLKCRSQFFFLVTVLSLTLASFGRLWLPPSSEETAETEMARTRDCTRSTPSASSASFSGRDWRRSSRWQCWWCSPTSSGLPNVNPAACGRSWSGTCPAAPVLVPTRPPSSCRRRSARSSRWWLRPRGTRARPRCRPRNRTRPGNVGGRSRLTT